MKDSPLVDSMADWMVDQRVERMVGKKVGRKVVRWVDDLGVQLADWLDNPMADRLVEY